MIITYCLLVLGYTCVNIPYGTLCGAMTQDIDERAKINTSRSVAAMIAIGIINIITVPLLGKLGSQSAKNGYLFVAIIYGCIFAACHFFCFAKTKEQVTIPEKEKISIKVQLKAVMQNRPYILALIGQVLFGFTLYGRNADILYYFTYVEGNASYYTTYSMCIIIPSIIGAACFQPVFRKLNNKGRTASIFAFLTGISMLAMYFFNVKDSAVVFYILAGVTQFFFQDLIQQSMQSFRTVWNTENGKPDFGMMDFNMHSFLLEIRLEWRSVQRCLRHYLENMDTWQIRHKMIRLSVL